LFWICAAEDVVKVEDNVFPSISDDDKERTLLLLFSVLVVCGGDGGSRECSYLDTIANEVGNAFITVSG
jgi:hypothetical protein